MRGLSSLPLAVFLLSAPPAVAQEVDFAREVRPLLSANCFQCHGPDGATREAGLRLDTREGAFAAGRRGAAIVAGDTGASLLAQRITSDEADERMPPSDSGRELSEEQRALLLRWIEEGAAWEEHWAFRAPDPPAVPTPPRAGELRNEVDAFVLARLEREGLAPGPQADRRTLARRLALDLTGLPPTRAEVEAFLADEAPDAWERLVEHYLASPQHGEHMARSWLDAARYGDTHGLHLDNYREMWPYRDWVVRAFDRNLPYDRFVVEQLAGDLLPEPTRDQLVATGFNRAHVSTNEGGSIVEEVLVRNVVDRASTTGTVFMGLTMGCALCHDHKFDPITQEEFFRFYAFFDSLDGDPMDGNVEDHAPVVKVPSAEQEVLLAALQAELEEVEERADELLRGIEYEDPEAPEAPGARTTIVWVEDQLPPGARAEGDGFEWVTGPEHPVRSGLRSMLRVSREGQQHFFTAADTKLRIGEGDRLFAWVHLDPEDPPKQVMLQFNSLGAAGGWMHRAYWGENRIEFGADGTSERRYMGPLPTAGEWVRLEVDAAEVGLFPGHAVHGLAFTQFDGRAWYDAAGIETSAPQAPADRLWIDDEPPQGAQLRGDGQPWQWVEGPGHPVKSGARSLRRGGHDGLHQDFFEGAPPLRLQHGDRLFAHVWIDPNDPPRSIQLQFNDGSWEHRVRWGDPAHGAGRGGGADFRQGELPPAGEWVRLEVGLAEVGLEPGDLLNGWAFTQVGGTVHWDAAGLRSWAPPDGRVARSLRVWSRIAAADERLPKKVRAAARAAPEERRLKAAALLRDHFLRHVYEGSRALFAPIDAELAAVQARVDALDAEIPTTLVWKERAEPRQTHVLERGQYDRPGAPVERGTPAILPPMNEELPRDRLGLAHWLVDPRHPLTARVQVNRLWQQLFGVGLVKTSEDFGNQGEPPSHPALLDWLATDLVASGWDLRHSLRRMLHSATYRRSARGSSELFARDPENRLLARGPRFRLDAEVLRDQALAVSGLLVPTIGGPGVKPPQPEGLWEAVGYTSSNTARFTPDVGREKVHRRTLYTFLKRTAPPPQLATFDAPSRESCVVRRERTNTPLQALLTLNDPQYVECARALAERILREGGADDSARAAWAFEEVTARPPAEAERAEIVGLVERQRARFAAEPARAAAMTTVGALPPDPALDPVELASWTLAAGLLLNLDEVLTKG